MILVFVGGGAGSLLRYLVTRGCETIAILRGAGAIPVATLTVNVVGCLVIGFLAAAVSKDVLREEHRLLLAVGLMGGFTTFSTYSLELVQKATDGHWVTAAAYLLLSNVLGVLATVGGLKLASATLG